MFQETKRFSKSPPPTRLCWSCLKIAKGRPPFFFFNNKMLITQVGAELKYCTEPPWEPDGTLPATWLKNEQSPARGIFLVRLPTFPSHTHWQGPKGCHPDGSKQSSALPYGTGSSSSTDIPLRLGHVKQQNAQAHTRSCSLQVTVPFNLTWDTGRGKENHSPISK